MKSEHFRALSISRTFRLPDLATPPEPLIDLALGKYELVVREAWQISENDPDIMALDPDDPPVIPLDQVNAPVLKALEKLAGHRKLGG